jgi:hypothetical protein
MMSGQAFIGSGGLMDVPVPRWIENDESLFGAWGLTLMAMLKHGRVETLKKGSVLTMGSGEVGLLIDGGLYCLDIESAGEDRALFVSFPGRGELFKAGASGLPSLTFQAHCKTTALVIPSDNINAFTAELAVSGRIMATLDLILAQQFAQAAQAASSQDIFRIERVLQMLAEHPSGTDTQLGREIVASKTLIRYLAGVHKRSASRSFKKLDADGCVTFYGYKRVFFRGK